MLLGYARVSTDDQSLDLQRDALNGAGCERLFEDHASGAQSDRAGLKLLLEVARAGDTVMIWRLDRLARSLKDLIAMVERLDAANVGLKSLREHIDTTSSGGKLVFHLLGALAEFERTLIRERTRAGTVTASRIWPSCSTPNRRRSRLYSTAPSKRAARPRCATECCAPGCRFDGHHDLGLVANNASPSR